MLRLDFSHALEGRALGGVHDFAFSDLWLCVQGACFGFRVGKV